MIRVRDSPEDVCASPLGGVVLQSPTVVPSENDGTALVASLHVLDRQGSIGTSFGSPYNTDDLRLFRYMAAGRVACDPNSPRIWAAYSTLGEVHAFDGNGELEWIARIADLEYPRLLVSDGAIRPDVTEMFRLEVIAQLELVTPRLLAVSVQSRSLRREDVDRRVYFLDAATGEAVGVAEEYEVIGSGYGAAIAYREAPAPEWIRIAASEGSR